MKKNLVYLLILILLGGLTYYFVFREDGGVFDKKEANFTVKDVNDITTIFLSSMQGENVKLSKTDHGWTLNDSLIPRQDAIDLLLETLHEQKATQPVSLSLHDGAIKELSTNSTKVEIYEGKEKTHTFYVGRNQAPNNATFMLTEGAKRPYIVKLPLQNTFVGIRYFTKLTEWLDKKILFKNSPVEFVKIDYKDSVKYSFEVNVSDTNYNVKGSEYFDEPLNKKRVKSYISFLDYLYCYGYEKTYIYKDSILKDGLQLGTVTVKRKNEKAETLTIYFKPTSQDTKAEITLNGKKYDFDIFFGYLNQKDFIVLDKEMVEKVFRTYREFYEADVAPAAIK